MFTDVNVFPVVVQLQMNLMQYDYIPPVDIKMEPYIPETGNLLTHLEPGRCRFI